jgi:diacylglycerol kinase
MRLIRSFKYALEGLAHCFRLEANFRIHLAFAISAVAAGYALHVSSAEWLVLLFCIGMVLSLELVNTAIERLCDVITAEYKAPVKVIKDVAAGAVLLAAITSIAIAAIIFIPKISELFKT